MWAVRILTGPQQGVVIPLEKGSYRLGRGPQCAIRITSQGISKEHAQLDVSSDRILLTDLNSRNGTFVNGRQVRTTSISPGDRAAIDDVIFDIIPRSAHPSWPSAVGAPVAVAQAQLHPQYQAQHQLNQHYQAQHHLHPQYQAQASFQTQESAEAAPQLQEQSKAQFQAIIDSIKKYVEDVALPGVYYLAEKWEFRQVLALMLLVFVVVVTGLAVLPLSRILKESIEKESQRRALTIARALADEARPVLMNGVMSALSTQKADSELGVSEALIISNIDGQILAPPSKMGQFPNQAFIHQARKEDRETVEQISDSTIGALVPIAFYDEATGKQSINAYAVVIYDMGVLSINDGRTLSLFVQTLVIAVIASAILFFFLFRLIEYPYRDLNRQLNEALKEGQGSVETKYRLEALQTLCNNINSALHRASTGNSTASPSFVIDRRREAEHLLELIDHPALVMEGSSEKIISVNLAFQQVTGLQGQEIVGRSFDSIIDQALRLSFQDLLQRIKEEPHELLGNEIPIAGHSYQLVGKGIQDLGQMGSAIGFFIFVLRPVLEGN